MKNKFLAQVVAGLFATTLISQAAAADLIAIYRDAVAQDPVYASARATYEAAKEASPQARAALLPAIALSGNSSRINSETVTAGITRTNDFTSKGYSLTLSQPLFRMQSWIAVDQAGLQVKQAEAVFADAQQNIVTRSAQAYFDVLLSQDNVTLSAAQKKSLRRAAQSGQAQL